MVVYHLDRGFLPVRDAVATLCRPAGSVPRGAVSSSPDEAPFMFVWELRQEGKVARVDVDAWDAAMLGATAGELRAAGVLTKPMPRYYLLPSVREGRFVGIY